MEINESSLLNIGFEKIGKFEYLLKRKESIYDPAIDIRIIHSHYVASGNDYWFWQIGINDKYLPLGVNHPQLMDELLKFIFILTGEQLTQND